MESEENDDNQLIILIFIANSFHGDLARAVSQTLHKVHQNTILGNGQSQMAGNINVTRTISVWASIFTFDCISL